MDMPTVTDNRGWGGPHALAYRKEARKGSRGIRQLACLEGELEDRSVIAISDGCHLN
jgi:hypothetical protein